MKIPKVNPVKLSKVVRQMETAWHLYSQGRRYYNAYRRKGEYVVRVAKSDSESLYMDLIEQHFSDRNDRILDVISNWSDIPKSTTLTFIEGSEATRKSFRVYGHPVVIRRFDSTTSGPSDLDPIDSDGSKNLLRALLAPQSGRATETIELVTRNHVAHQAVLRYLRDRYSKLERPNTVAIYTMPKGQRYWTATSQVQPRPLSSVVLSKGVEEDVLGDLESFLDSEEKYQGLGAPWHRGYLLYGPPGTGKTSLIKAIASLYGFSLYVLTLADFDSDSSVMHAVSAVGNNSILLIEDLHTALSARKEVEVGVTKAGLAQRAGRCDYSARSDRVRHHPTTSVRSMRWLVRPGRIDRTIEIRSCGLRSGGQVLGSVLPEQQTGSRGDASEGHRARPGL